ncbi:hypothetical protein FIBSPDRAFT_495169 [Athelia psychrophila]|uniref:Uncharacterized protein n=1 Tax=Athelia psychrophila TaxID=1759441 RepID=A0A166KIK3_9AGAM|nr:hypothetical protein FIBSPDRAFT_495169 [Fibularhizoctonia sp. CBS 109695]
MATRTMTPSFNSTRTADNPFGDEYDLDDSNGNKDNVPANVTTRAMFQSTFDTTHAICHRVRWLSQEGAQDGRHCKMLLFRWAAFHFAFTFVSHLSAPPSHLAADRRVFLSHVFGPGSAD